MQHSITVIDGGIQYNMIPEYATLQGNIRPTPAFDNQQVLTLIKRTIDHLNAHSPYQLELTVLQNFQPVATRPDHPFIQQALQVTRHQYTNSVDLSIINGATDASVFTLHRPDLPVAILDCDF